MFIVAAPPVPPPLVRPIHLNRSGFGNFGGCGIEGFNFLLILLPETVTKPFTIPLHA